MPLISNFLAIIGLLFAFTVAVAPSSARAEQRIALVLGNAAYESGALKTPANDAGLIAQTLEAAGFEVIGARDLDNDALRRAFRDFVDKAAALGPDGVAVLYLGGYGLQLEGENYFVPVDARIERASDIPVHAVRLSDYTRALAALKLKASIVVLDLARSHPFAPNEALAGGLALVEPEPGMLIAFNAAPGTIAPAAEGAYGPYAKALAEMVREGGLPLNELFDHVRLRVSDATQGAQVPWHASNVVASFVFFERTADAPPSVAANEVSPALRSRRLRDLGAQEGYIAALERDALPDYLEFLDSYATDPLANRVRAIVAARREALIWRRTRWLDTPAAYWSYLRLYSDGPHAGDCYRRLAFLHASLEAQQEFSPVDYDVPPPPPEERIYIQHRVIFFGDPAYDLPPPPAIPAAFLPPFSQEVVDLPPPEPPQELFVLPTPVYTALPAWVRPPDYVRAPPANNVIFANVHNKVVIDRAAKTFTVTERGGHTRMLQAPRAGFQNDEQRPLGEHAGARRQLPAADANVGPALPHSVAQLATRTNGTRPDRTQREQRPLPLPGAREGGSAATRQLSPQPAPPHPFWTDRPQRQVDEVVRVDPQQRTQPLTRLGEPLPKAVPAPAAPRSATRTTPPVPAPQGEPGQGLFGGRPQLPAPDTPPAAFPRSAPSAQAGQPVPQAKPQVPPAAALRPQGPTHPPQVLPKVTPQSATPPTGLPQQQLDRQRAQQEQAAAAARQRQQAAEAARQAAAATTARQQQQQASQQAAAARAQQQAVQQAAAARAQQQAAQQAAAARAQQQAAQQAAAARAQQQAAQQAAAARAQQQAAQQAAAARAQQQAAQQAAAARAQQQAAQQAAAARAQQQAAQQAAAARAQQQAAQQAAAARAQQQAAQQAAAARAQQQAAQQAAAARAQQQAAQQAAAARTQQQAAQQAAAAARASAAIGAARAQHVPPQRR